ncbi:uncharacterized protein G2W53_030521 [Senna tora]|uniref:Uncharacterized protein n=1 Tax=Senna tora TaxID=362788 RepID=A0A834T774_9FABA|nr:uncharacterized protein G2W53_030521 [Senna tora]
MTVNKITEPKERERKGPIGGYSLLAMMGETRRRMDELSKSL